MKISLRGTSLFMAIVFCNGAAVNAKSVKIHGYVTEVHSERSFEIDEYKIMRDQSLTLDFEKEEGSVVDEPVSSIRIGTELEIKGDLDMKTGELSARSIKVYSTELRRLKRTALVEQIPELRKTNAYWEGTLRVDGQVLSVNETTQVNIVPSNAQKKSRKEAAKRAKKAAATDAQEPEPEGVVLTKLDDLHTNMFVAYEGRRRQDGRIDATKLTFKDNEMTNGEARLWKTLTPKVRAFKGTGPGEIRVGGGKFKITANPEAQQYIQRLGESLIPPLQRDLAKGDANKIPFQFYLIDSKVPNAFATANGVVCVHTAMLSGVENEAQLAFVIGHEIAHATEKHTLRQMEFHKKKRLALQVGAAVAQAYGKNGVKDLLVLTSATIQNGYQRFLEDQADRVGMEYMIAAGYDAREAPRAWKAMALKYGDAPTNFFWSSHDNHTTRRSYLMAELRNNYDGVDLSSKRKDSEAFQKIRAYLEQRQHGKIKVKTKY
jgi:hypothetical protein